MSAYVSICPQTVNLAPSEALSTGVIGQGRVEAIMSDVGRRRMLSEDGRWKMNPVRCPAYNQGKVHWTQRKGSGCRLVAVVGRPLGVGSLALCVVGLELG